MTEDPKTAKAPKLPVRVCDAHLRRIHQRLKMFPIGNLCDAEADWGAIVDQLAAAGVSIDPAANWIVVRQPSRSQPDPLVVMVLVFAAMLVELVFGGIPGAHPGFSKRIGACPLCHARNLQAISAAFAPESSSAQPEPADDEWIRISVDSLARSVIALDVAAPPRSAGDLN